MRPHNVELVRDEETGNVNGNDKHKLGTPPPIMNVTRAPQSRENQHKNNQVVEEKGEAHSEHGFNAVAAGSIYYTAIAVRVNALVPVPLLGTSLQSVEQGYRHQEEENGVEDVKEFGPGFRGHSESGAPETKG